MKNVAKLIVSGMFGGIGYVIGMKLGEELIKIIDRKRYHIIEE